MVFTFTFHTETLMSVGAKGGVLGFQLRGAKLVKMFRMETFQAKLKPHIHDPNAPELIHFMWTILCLLVDACRDPRNGTPDLASKVVSPLLTREAKDLLLNCLTSKEMELWMSLGDAWTVAR